MLQLLPAILLLMLQGPATLNRGALSEKMPEAIRLIIEMRQPEDESGAEPALEESNELAEWLGANATSVELSTAIAHLLGLDSAPAKVTQLEFSEPDFTDKSVFVDPPAAVSIAEASKSHPCRAGPAFRLA